MRKVKLTKGKFALVDNNDFEMINEFKWFAYQSRKNIFRAGRRSPNHINKRIDMARFIMDCPSDRLIDHINGDTLDNQKCNLRICTHEGNNRNRKKQTKCTSQFKGVGWHKRDKIWRTQITICDKQKHLGNFTSEKDAAKTYDKAAKKYFGKFANLNFK